MKNGFGARRGALNASFGVHPTFSNIAAAFLSSTSETITWNTNLDSSSQVQYGLTTAYGSTSSLDPTPTKNHSVILTGLSVDTLYHYRVKSGTSTSSDQTFTTGQSEVTRFTFPSGASYGYPNSQSENMVCSVASGLTPGAYGINTVTCNETSSLTPGSIGRIYLQVLDDGTTVGQSAYFIFNDPNNGIYYVWMNINGGGSDPFYSSYGIEVAISSGWDNQQIADEIVLQLSNNGFFAFSTGDGQLYWDLNYSGSTSASILSGFSSSNIYISNPGALSPYFNLEGWAVWFRIDGVGGPIPLFVDQVTVDVSSFDNATDVATALALALFNTNGDQWGATSDGNIVTYHWTSFNSDTVDGNGNPTNFLFNNAIPQSITPYFYFGDPQAFGIVAVSFYFTINGVGPEVGANPTEVALANTDTASQVATKLAAAMVGAGFGASVVTSTTVRFSYTRSDYPNVDAPAMFNLTGFSSSLQSASTPSPYFLFNTTTTSYYVYGIISPNGDPYYGIDPALPGKTGIQMFGGGTGDNSTLVATRFNVAIQDFLPAVAVTRSQSTNNLTITNNIHGAVTDASASTNPAPFTSGFTITVLTQGS